MKLAEHPAFDSYCENYQNPFPINSSHPITVQFQKFELKLL